jgi:hypothetical protein
MKIANNIFKREYFAYICGYALVCQSYSSNQSLDYTSEFVFDVFKTVF